MRGGVRRGWRVDLGGGVKVKQAVSEDARRLRVRRTDGVRECVAARREGGRSGGGNLRLSLLMWG